MLLKSENINLMLKQYEALKINNKDETNFLSKECHHFVFTVSLLAQKTQEWSIITGRG